MFSVSAIFDVELLTKILMVSPSIGSPHSAGCSKDVDGDCSQSYSASKGVNQRSKDATRAQQQRPESPTISRTWYASEYTVHKLYQRYSL